LGELATLIGWEPFRVIVGDLYTNTTEQGGRPNIDVVFMIKLLVLQSMVGLSDPELELQANDKISFQRFLWSPENDPDQTTVWYFREQI
jgi:IS5 family transposase